ncbi:hypothetical protein C9374_004775 [Naegleria lovaniensis]|uniref:Uncharacterized protein n=1 Tax=Naegleria lovaniensis TaxID=51637 RepID=A0AA88GQQ7_NAELO|nr:uncharacterized protein C9374_004775 [Naegleria lovaniensis]KAG2382808.1 hypothetical protein C9374_004775 [Naegleria lovaniensis]
MLTTIEYQHEATIAKLNSSTSGGSGSGSSSSSSSSTSNGNNSPGSSSDHHQHLLLLDSSPSSSSLLPSFKKKKTTHGLPVQNIKYLSTMNLLNKPITAYPNHHHHGKSNSSSSVGISLLSSSTGSSSGSSSSVASSSSLNSHPTSSGALPSHLIADPLFLYSQQPQTSNTHSQDQILEQLYSVGMVVNSSSANNNHSTSTNNSTNIDMKQQIYKNKTFSKQLSFDVHVAEMGGKNASNSTSASSNQNFKNILVDPQLDELMNRYRSQIMCLNTSDNGKFVVFALRTAPDTSNQTNTSSPSKPNLLIVIYSRNQQIQQVVSNMSKNQQTSGQTSMSQKIKTIFNGSSYDSPESKKGKKGIIGNLLSQLKSVTPPRGMHEMDVLSWKKKLKSTHFLNKNTREQNRMYQDSSTQKQGEANNIHTRSSSLGALPSQQQQQQNYQTGNINLNNLPPVSVKQIFISNDGYNVVCVTENNDIWLYDCFPSNRSNIANLFKYENSMFRINPNSTNQKHMSTPNVGNSSASFGYSDSKRMSESRNTINATLLPSSNVDSLLEEETYHRYLMRTNNQGLFAIDDFGVHYHRHSVVGNDLLPTPRDPILSVGGMGLHFPAASSSFASSTMGNYLQYSIEEWTILPSHLDGLDSLNHRAKESSEAKHVLLPNEDIYFDIKFCHSPIHGRFCQISSAIVSKMFVKQEIYNKMQSLFQAGSPESEKNANPSNTSMGVINSNNASIMKHHNTGLSSSNDEDMLLSSSSLLKGQGNVLKESASLKDSSDEEEEKERRSHIKSRRSPSVFRHMSKAQISTTDPLHSEFNDDHSPSSDSNKPVSRQASLVSLPNSVKIPKLKLGSTDSDRRNDQEEKREMVFETFRNDIPASKKASGKNIGRMSMILSRSGIASALETSNSGLSTPRLISRVGTFSGASADSIISTYFDDFNNLPSPPSSPMLRADMDTPPNILSRCLVITNCTVYLSKRKFSKSANSFNTNPIPTPRFPIIDHCPFHLNIDRTYTVLDKVLEEEDQSLSKAFHTAAKQKNIPECVVRWDNETSMLCVVANSFDHSSLFESKVFFYSPLRRKSFCLVYGTKSLECLPMSRTSRNPIELVSFSVQDMCWSNNSLFVLLIDARGNMSMIGRLNEFMFMKDKQVLQQSVVSNFVPFYKNASESRDLETTRFSITSHPYQGQFVISDGYKVKLFNYVSERDEIDLTTILSSYHGSCFGIEQYIFHATYAKKSKIDTALEIWRLCVSHPQLSRFQKQNHNYLEFVIKKLSEYILNHGESFSKRISMFFDVLQDSLDWSINGVQNPNFLLPYLIKLTELVFRRLLKKEKTKQYQRLAEFLQETERKCNELVHYCQSCFVWDTNTLGDTEADSIRQSPIILFDCWVELGQCVQKALSKIASKPTDKTATIIKLINSEKKNTKQENSTTSLLYDSSDEDEKKKPSKRYNSDSDDSNDDDGDGSSDTSTEYLGDDYEGLPENVKVVSSDDESEGLESKLKDLLEIVIQKLKNRTAYLTNKFSPGNTFQERYATTLNPRSKSIYKFSASDVKCLLTGNNQYMLGNYKKAVKYYSRIHESNEENSPNSSNSIPSSIISYYTKTTVLFLTYLFMYDITEVFRVLNDQMHTGIVDLVRSSGVLMEHHKTNISKGLGSGVLKSHANMNIVNAVITLLTSLYEKKDVYVLSPVFYQILVDKIAGNDVKNISIDLVCNDPGPTSQNSVMSYYYIPLNMRSFKNSFEAEMKKRSVNGKSIVTQLLLETGRIHEAIRFCLRFDYKKAFTIFLVTNGMLGSKDSASGLSDSSASTNSQASNNSVKAVPNKKVIGSAASQQQQRKPVYDTQQIVNIYKELLYEYLDKEDSKEVNTILSTTDFFISKQSDELRVGAIETYLRKLQFMLKETCSLLFVSKEDTGNIGSSTDKSRRARASIVKEKKTTRKLSDLLDKEFLITESHFLSNICQFITSQKPNKPSRKQREYHLSLLDAIRSGNLLPHITYREYKLKYLRRINEDVSAFDEEDSHAFMSRGDSLSNQPLITVIEKECEKSVRFLLMDQLVIFSNIPNLTFVDLLKYYQNEYCFIKPRTKLSLIEEKESQLSLYIKPFRFLCRFLWYCHITEEISAITSNNQTNPFKLLYSHAKQTENSSEDNSEYIDDLTDTLVYTCELFAFLLDFREFFTRTFLESTLLTILTVAINISHSSKDDEQQENNMTRQSIAASNTSDMNAVNDLSTATTDDTKKVNRTSMIAETVCRILGKHMHDSQQVVPHLGKRYMQLYKALDLDTLNSNISQYEQYRKYTTDSIQINDKDTGASILWACEAEESYWTFLNVFFNDVLSSSSGGTKDLMSNITAAISKNETSSNSLIADSLTTLKHSLQKIKMKTLIEGHSSGVTESGNLSAKSNHTKEETLQQSGVQKAQQQQQSYHQHSNSEDSTASNGTSARRQLSARQLINDFNTIIASNNNNSQVDSGNNSSRKIPNRRSKSIASSSTATNSKQDEDSNNNNSSSNKLIKTQQDHPEMEETSPRNKLRDDYENAKEKYPLNKKRSGTLNASASENDSALGLVMGSMDPVVISNSSLMKDYSDEKKRSFSIKNLFNIGQNKQQQTKNQTTSSSTPPKTLEKKNSNVTETLVTAASLGSPRRTNSTVSYYDLASPKKKPSNYPPYLHNTSNSGDDNIIGETLKMHSEEDPHEIVVEEAESDDDDGNGMSSDEEDHRGRKKSYTTIHI